MRREVFDAWLNRPVLDHVLVAVGVAVLVLIDPHNVPDESVRSAWIQTLASVTGVLLGLAGVAVTVVFAVTPTDRLAAAYGKVGHRMVRLVVSSLAGMSVGLVGFVALFVVPNSNGSLRDVITVASILIVGLRFGRLLWIFERVLAALVPIDRTASGEIPDGQEWVRPVVSEDDYAVGARRARRRRTS